jgi:hypothetical protein
VASTGAGVMAATLPAPECAPPCSFGQPIALGKLSQALDYGARRCRSSDFDAAPSSGSLPTPIRLPAQLRQSLPHRGSEDIAAELCEQRNGACRIASSSGGNLGNVSALGRVSWNCSTGDSSTACAITVVQPKARRRLPRWCDRAPRR